MGHNEDKINEAVLQLIKDINIEQNDTINIGILVPFENQNWHAGVTATVRYYYNLINKSGYDCSMYTNSMQGAKKIKNIHVTTFKSSKGLEFDFVIIPDFNLLNVNFKVVDWRDFYVGITRTRSNLYLISRSNFPDLSDEGPNKVIDKVFI